MPQLTAWRAAPADSVSLPQISFYFDTCCKNKNSHVITLPFSDPSSCYSSASRRQNWGVRSSRSGKDHLGVSFSSGKNTPCEEKCEAQVAESSKRFISIDVKSLIARRLPRWGRFLLKSKKLRSMIVLNLIAVVYASNIPVVKEVEGFMDPAAFAAVRFTIAAIPFLPFVFQATDDVETRNAGIELGFWISLGYLVEALGLLTSEAGRASFISLFTVLVVPLLESMLGAIVPARTWFGILMSILGIGMLECSGSPPNIGDLLNFLSAIFFGIHTLRTAHLSRSTRKENFMALLGYEVCVLAILSTVWYLVGGSLDGLLDSDANSWTWPLVWDWMVSFPWIPALYTGVFSTGVCLWAEIDAMRDVSAIETSVIYAMEPLWGAGFAWFVLGERWGTAGWMGAALMLGGSLIVQIYGALPSESEEEMESEENGELPSTLVSERQKMPNSLAAAPVVVRSKKDVM